MAPSSLAPFLLSLLPSSFPPFLCFFLGPVVGAAASPPLLFPFCCTLSSTFPLKLPCTPLHPWYLAAVVDVAAAPKFNVGAAVDPVEAEVAVDNPKPPKAGVAVVFRAADTRGSLREMFSSIPDSRRKLSSLLWRSKRWPPRHSGAVM